MEYFDIEANGFTFAAISAGARGARTVVFLHGFPQTSWSWNHQLDAVAEAGLRGLAFDQRGYSPGARPEGVDAYHIDNLVADVVAVADAEGLEHFDVVGHDWGALVAWVLARRHAHRIRTLTAVSVPHPAAFVPVIEGGDEDQARRSSYIAVFRQEGVAERTLLGDDRSGDGLRAMFSASGLSPDAEETEVFVAAMRDPGALTAALNWYRAMDPATRSVGSVSVPTLFVWSTEDVAIGRKAAEATAEHVKGPYRFEVLQGVSHWVPETAPKALSALILEHLARY